MNERTVSFNIRTWATQVHRLHMFVDWCVTVYCSPAPCETSSKVLSISWNASLARPGRLISWSASSIRQINHRSRVSTQQVILSDVQNVNRQMNIMDVGVRQRARSLDRTRHHIPIPADAAAGVDPGRPAQRIRRAWPWFPARVAFAAAQCPDLSAKQATTHHSPSRSSSYPPAAASAPPAQFVLFQNSKAKL